jgi:hypothetical protein
VNNRLTLLPSVLAVYVNVSSEPGFVTRANAIRPSALELVMPVATAAMDADAATPASRTVAPTIGHGRTCEPPR